MVTLAIVVFAITALGGVYLASRHFTQKPLPGNIAIVHGAAGATGLVVLGIAALTQDLSNTALTAFAIFAVTALGGFYLVSFHLRGVRHPSPVVVAHGAIAVIAFVTLFTTLF
jgi:hypothetical protein